MAAITAAGFAGALAQLHLSLNDSRAARAQGAANEEQAREAMARAVGIKSNWHPAPDGCPPNGDGLIPVDVEIMNSGPYPITGAVLFLATDHEDIPMQVVYGTVVPGERLEDTFTVKRSEITSGELTGGATLVFTDTYGTNWSSSTSWQGLERRKDPARIC